MNVKPLEEEKENKVVSDIPKLQLITGGKGGGPDHNWLADMATGTVFLARHKSSKIDDPIMGVFELLFMSEDKRYAYISIKAHLKEQQNVDVYVDTLIFSRQYTFGTILGKVTDG